MSYKLCSVLGCQNNNKKNKELAFFTSKNESLLKKWLEANNRGWKETTTIYVCSEHFQKKGTGCFIHFPLLNIASVPISE